MQNNTSTFMEKITNLNQRRIRYFQNLEAEAMGINFLIEYIKHEYEEDAIKDVLPKYIQYSSDKSILPDRFYTTLNTKRDNKAKGAVERGKEQNLYDLIYKLFNIREHFYPWLLFSTMFIPVYSLLHYIIVINMYVKFPTKISKNLYLASVSGLVASLIQIIIGVILTLLRRDMDFYRDIYNTANTVTGLFTLMINSYWGAITTTFGDVQRVCIFSAVFSTVYIIVYLIILYKLVVYTNMINFL